MEHMIALKNHLRSEAAQMMSVNLNAARTAVAALIGIAMTEHEESAGTLVSILGDLGAADQDTVAAIYNHICNY